MNRPLDSHEEMNAPPKRVRGRPARLALKELRETLRDRRTLITLVLMPLLVYPLLGVILQKVMLSAVVKPEESHYSVAFASPEDAERFQQLYHARKQKPIGEVPQPKLKMYSPQTEGEEFDPIEMIAQGGADLAVRFSEPKNGDPRSLPQLELIYQHDDPHSQAVALAVQRRLQLLVPHPNPNLVRNRPEFFFPNQGSRAVVLRPVKPEQVAKPRFSLATFVPLMLILMTVTGAVYPAIDLTAGERERGTLEVLIAAPVPRMELLGAKFVAVLSVAMLTAIVNLAAMLITVYASGLESLVFGEGGISWPAMGQIFVLLILFAAFFSAVLLALTSFARSFKEAQAYLIPLMLVALAPGVFSLTPGLKMNGLLAVTPLVNIVLLGRDLLEGNMVPLLFAGAVMSTVLYAILALTLAARVFGSDAILYGSQGSVRDLFRRPKQVRPHPTLTQVMFALAVLFPAFIILGSLPGRFSEFPMSVRLGLSSAITILLFAGWPSFLAWRNAVPLKSAFRSARPSAWMFLGAMLWGLSLWMFAYELEVLTISPNRLEMLSEVFETIKYELNQVPLAWRLLTLALVPAVCEELFFRGYLIGGLRARISPWATVLVSAGLFGLFHVIVRDVLFFERFIPTALMGVMLGWLAVKSGSVWPGMLLHVLHNGLLLTLGAFQSKLMAWGVGLESRQHLPWSWLVSAGVIVLAGGVFITRFPNTTPKPASPIDHQGERGA